jgi:hypothetical protein
MEEHSTAPWTPLAKVFLMNVVINDHLSFSEFTRPLRGRFPSTRTFVFFKFWLSLTSLPFLTFSAILFTIYTTFHLALSLLCPVLLLRYFLYKYYSFKSDSFTPGWLPTECDEANKHHNFQAGGPILQLATILHLLSSYSCCHPTLPTSYINNHRYIFRFPPPKVFCHFSFPAILHLRPSYVTILHLPPSYIAAIVHLQPWYVTFLH